MIHHISYNGKGRGFMKSYALAMAVSMFLAAIYAFQNTTTITVQFLMFAREVPQGLWEVLLFSSGLVLMWLFSILASLELRSNHRAQIKERDEKIALLEEEKSSLLAAFKHMPSSPEVFLPAEPPVPTPLQDPELPLIIAGADVDDKKEPTSA